MKSDTQHLDFLISQYVDGTLDPASKKSLEQTLLANPQARGLYKEHRDVQDTLDDWGNRIPMIDWDNFDARLGERLEQETVGSEKPSIFRRWAKPMAAAAALFIAATIGYTWHAWTSPSAPVNPTIEVVAQPQKIVPFEVERPADKVPGQRKFEIAEELKGGSMGTVVIDTTTDGSEERANGIARPQTAGSVTAFQDNIKKSDKDQPTDPTPLFPYP